MTLLEVPVWDEGIGEYITRRLSIVVCLAHIGDDSSEPKFRLYLSEFGHNGKLKSVGVDEISNEYLSGFVDQIKRLHELLIAEGERNWAGTKVDFSRSKLVEMMGG